MRPIAIATITLMAACSSPGGGGAADANGDAVPDDDGAVAAECSGPVAEASLCLNSASGRPGDRVMLDVYIVLPDGCASTTQVSTKIVPASSIGTFVERPLSKPACWSMQDDLGTGTLFFATASALGAGCPESLPPGLLVTIELDVATTTVAGTYDLRLEQAHLGDNLAACRGMGAISGQLTVLP